MEFLGAVLEFGFLRHALLAGALAGIACGVVGSYVVVRRITYIAGAIAHSTLGGMGAALYLQRNLGWSFLSPMHWAVFAGLLAVMIGLLLDVRSLANLIRHRDERELPIDIRLVISSRPSARGVQIAREAGIETPTLKTIYPNAR